jgi:tetratricopeptide (TPR) repeat protein
MVKRSALDSACAILAAGLVLCASCARGPVPPDTATLDAIDPAVKLLLDEMTAAVHADRADGARWGDLAMAYEANGLLVHAAQVYDVAVELDQREPRWRYRRALLAARRGEMDSALADLEVVITLAPGYGPARWRKGLWLLDRAQPDEAAASFRAALEAAPADPAGAIGLALVHLSKREDTAAATALERVLEKSPGERYALHLLGTAYQRLGRTEQARFALSVGRGGQPAWADPWAEDVDRYRRGFAVMLKEATELGMDRRFTEAIALLEQLRSLRPDDTALRVYLGGMYAAAGRMPEATSTLEPILAADPRHFDANMHLASGYLLTGALDDAAAYATRALALRPASADAAKLQGMVDWQQGRNPEALTRFDAAAAADPRDPIPLLWMGMIHGQQGQYLRARERFEAALSKNPLLGDALIGLADTYAATGDFVQAQAIIERAGQAEPGNPRLAAARERIGAAARSGR